MPTKTRIAPVVADILAHASRRPDAPAVTDPSRRLSFGELARATERTAAALRAEGVEAGDRVGLVSENSTDYLVAALATWAAGAVLAPIHPAFGPSELDYVLGNANPRLILTQRGHGSELADRDVRTCGLEAIAAGEGDRGDTPAVDVDPAAPALIYYTSGSTGRPKPVAHSHAGIAAGTHAFTEVWHLGPDDRSLVCLPMSWAFGLTTGSISTLVAGGSVVILPRYNPVHVSAAIEEEGVTVLHGVTTMFVKLLEYLGEAGRDLSTDSLRLCISGGEPRNERAFERWRALTGCAIYDNYCASECWPVVTYDPRADPEPHPGSAGTVVPGAALRIIGDDGAEVPQGETGEGIWRAPAQMLGYWEEPDLSRDAFTADGWFHSRDLVRMDSSGHVYVVGRVADTIITGGNNVSPSEVETVLGRHASVSEVAVVGVADEVYGEAVAAAVVLAPGAEFDPDALAELGRGSLAPYKVPTHFHRVDRLPRNANGKLLRREVGSLIRTEDGQMP
jgi:long-chain acyl-CoA synthetase